MKMETHYFFLKNMLKEMPYADRITRTDKILLFLGVTVTDFSPSRCVHAHYYLKSLEYTDRQVKKLQKKAHWNKRDVFNAGKQFHYLMDFFCAVHQEEGLRKPVKHLKYEQELHTYFVEKCKESERKYIPFAAIRDQWIQNLHEKYAGQEVAFENDFIYSSMSCKTFLYMVVSKLATTTAKQQFAERFEWKGI